MIKFETKRQLRNTIELLRQVNEYNSNKLNSILKLLGTKSINTKMEQEIINIIKEKDYAKENNSRD